MGEEELYREVILDHYKNPRNEGELLEAERDIEARGVNPFCGDELTLHIKADGGRASALRLQVRGCAISCASASMMSELIKGKTFDEIKDCIERFRSNMLSSHGALWPEGWQDLEVLEGVRKYPVRIKCALLAWNTLKESLRDFETKGPHIKTAHQEEAW